MPLTNLLQFTRCEESWRVPRTGFENIPVFGNSRRKCNANSPASIPAPACPLPSWLRFRISVGARPNINARISHLPESETTSLKDASTAAGPPAAEYLVAHELLSREIPEGRTIKRRQNRTHLRL